MTPDQVESFLKKRGCPEHIWKAGREGLVQRWKDFVAEVERGYCSNCVIEEYWNDLDARELIHEIGADRYVRDVDKRFADMLTATEIKHWHAERNTDYDFWNFGYPKNATGLFLEDINRHFLMLANRKSQMRKAAHTEIGRPSAVDHTAVSASKTEPGFLARPHGAPVYHGFQVLVDITIEGFMFGKITDFEAESCQSGDAFIIAPDDSRAGLVWEVSDQPFSHETCPPTSERWGVWTVSFPLPMTTHDNVRRNLESVLPELKKRWEEWRQNYAK